MLLLSDKNYVVVLNKEKNLFSTRNNFYVLKEALKDFALKKISHVGRNDNSKSYFNSSKTLNILALMPEVLPL